MNDRQMVVDYFTTYAEDDHHRAEEAFWQAMEVAQQEGHLFCEIEITVGFKRPETDDEVLLRKNYEARRASRVRADLAGSIRHQLAVLGHDHRGMSDAEVVELAGKVIKGEL